jgi:protein-S-isoprenylcysteine O-methyltransferase Ste14
LVGGYWGMARKINYLGDILIGVAWSMTVGVPTTSNILGYIYPIYLTILLFTRASRDDARCREKYGKHWEEYCKKVKYMIIPYVY